MDRFANSTPDAAARMPQADVYGAVHKGIRYALLDLLRRMGTVSPSETSQVDMVLDDLESVFYLCVAHSAQEERFVHTVIEAENPAALVRLDAAHAGLGDLLDRLREATAAVQCAEPDARPGLFRSLYLRYSSFVAQALQHMCEEEIEVQALLERMFSPEKIRAIQHAMLASIGPEELLAFLRVMVPAATPNERAVLLAQPKASLSREAFEAIMLTVRRCLNAAEVRDLERRLEQMA